MLRYYNTWKFKHPNVTDFKRVMEKASGLELDWYFEYWINSTHNIDYEVTGVEAFKKGSKVNLKRLGKMPMPLDILVTYKDGSQELIYIPLVMMRGEKPAEAWYGDVKRTVQEDWPWTNEEYSFTLDKNPKNIDRIVIDPSFRVADIDRRNNHYPESSRKKGGMFGSRKKRDEIRE